MRLATFFHKNKSAIAKSCRILSYFLLLIGLCYQIQRLYKKLKVEPETFTKESSIQSSEILFPAVTICPPFVIKKESWDAAYLKARNLTEDHLQSILSQTCPNYSDYKIYMKLSNFSIDHVDVLLKTSQSFNESLDHCGLNEFFMYNQNCEKLFIQTVTDFGVCYTFNMLGHDSMFNNEVSSNFDTLKRTKIAKSWDPKDTYNPDTHDDYNDPEPSKWNLATGYSVDDEYIQPARALKKQTLMLMTRNIGDQKLCDDREKSFKIILHMPNELPQISYEGIDIQLGKEVTVMISAEVVEYEESLWDFPPDIRGCYFNGEKLLRYFKSYTKANCEYECLSNFTYKSCGCVKFSMPRTENMKTCQAKDIDCYMDITEKFPRSYYRDLRNKKKFPHYPCGCMPSCTEIQYFVVKEVMKDAAYGEFQLHSQIKVVFTNSQIEKTSNYSTYEMENFIFDIGGLIGLFLGSSILSMLELLLSIGKLIQKWIGRVVNMCWNISKTRGPIDMNAIERSVQLDVQVMDTPVIVIEVPIDDQQIDIHAEDLESCEVL